MKHIIPKKTGQAHHYWGSPYTTPEQSKDAYNNLIKNLDTMLREFSNGNR